MEFLNLSSVELLPNIKASAGLVNIVKKTASPDVWHLYFVYIRGEK